ncbi:MAG: hypothetical protein NWT08_10130 [Akkermansiaceae bacterium]|nr:hypothetical protein [Akkermansiaceae bacterium]MDP4721201.1 hypothetical protein [Akkermansiaceae bacterium]MDP4778849.1 hypothetical protein [Akkermansiaceae bacterium]MDP4846950.1 hypothetical protein [Akkermansiaceae bacterium]MDP4897912.1 hypothetical protein [Akkermansiaceae bacterium]
MLAITSQSFWMDEAGGAFKSLTPGFSNWVSTMFRFGGSDVQMPFYMCGLWLWHRLGFISEYGFRLINIPFLILMVLALKRVRFWPLVCLTSPFLIYYVGELRPYTMQMAAGSLAALGIFRIIDGKRNGQELSGLHTTAAGCFLLCASSLSAAVFALGIACAVAIIRPDWIRKKIFWLRSIPWMVSASILAAYFIYTLLEGHRAASTGGSLLSMGFGFYEMIGLVGLGPSRDMIRENPSIVLRSLPWLLPATLIIFFAWLIGAFSAYRSTTPRERIAIIVAVALPLLVLAVTSLVAQFQVLGRHLSPAIPALLLPVATCLSGNFPKKIPAISIGSAAILISLTSALLIRFNPIHFRDDYRTASHLAIALLDENQTILWKADTAAPSYYAYRKNRASLTDTFMALESHPPAIESADCVIINRPDLRFPSINHKTYLLENGFTLTETPKGFEIWKTP